MRTQAMLVIVAHALFLVKVPRTCFLLTQGQIPWHRHPGCYPAIVLHAAVNGITSSIYARIV